MAELIANAAGASGPSLGDAHDPAVHIQELLSRMGMGDRDAAAEFVMKYGSRIRRRVRGKLGPTMRRIFDSQEILSTVGRRLDLYVQAGKLVGVGIPQLWALVFRMAENAVVDKARVFRRLEQIEDEDGEFAHDLANRLHDAETCSENGAEDAIERCLGTLSDPIDRQILSFWLNGRTHADTARVLDLAPTNVRKRWEMIKNRLRDRLSSEAAPV